MANHTTPIDVVILANDGCYAMVSIGGAARRRVSCGDVTALRSVLSSGGSDPRGADGDHAEVDGALLSSRVVREVGDEGPPRCEQQVRTKTCRCCMSQQSSERLERLRGDTKVL